MNIPNNDKPTENTNKSQQDQTECTPSNQSLRTGESQQNTDSNSQRVSLIINEDTLQDMEARPSTSAAAALLTPRRSFEQLLLERVSPKTVKPKVKRRKVDTEAVVITSETYFEKIKQQEEVKKNEDEKKEARRKDREEKKQKREGVRNNKGKECHKKIITLGSEKKQHMPASSSEEEDFEVDKLCQEISDGSLHFSETSEDEFDEEYSKKSNFKVPSNLRTEVI